MRVALAHRALPFESQLPFKSYLRVTRLRVGLLFNFNAPILTIKRMVQD